VDLRWAGGYTCERWDWDAHVTPDTLAAAIAPLPAAALEAILATGRPAPAAPTGDAGAGAEYLQAKGFDPVAVLAATAAWLESPAAPLPSEGTGHATLMVVFGAVMVGWGWDAEIAQQLIEEFWNPRCAVPWTNDEIATQFPHKAEEIERLGSEAFGELELACAWRDVERGRALLAADADGPLALPAPAMGELESADALEEHMRNWNAYFQHNARGEAKNTDFNTLLTLDLHYLWRGLFGFDEFTQSVVFLRDCQARELPAKAGDLFDYDSHVVGMRCWFGRELHEPHKSAMIDCVNKIARDRPIHAVRQYLDRVRGTWDGVDRNLVTYLGAEPTPYQRAVCQKWLRSAVARVMKPGSKADCLLILEGLQGAKKSTALKCLCPDVRWFYECASRDVGNKDFMQDMRGKWLSEIPEVDQLIRSRDESELKALLSRTSDNYRPSYARASKEFPRQLVFAGTTNESAYLRDATGNRRYWAVACSETGPIDEAAICDDRDQLWAQALTEYEAGQRWWLEGEEVLAAADAAELRLEEDPWGEHLQEWVESQGAPFTSVEALGGLMGAKKLGELTAADVNRMGKTLRKLGFVSHQCRIGGVKAIRWFKPAALAEFKKHPAGDH